MKKQILLYILFFVYNVGKSQVYQPFIFINNEILNYDMPRQQLAEKALDFYYAGNSDSSIFYYKKLLDEMPNYYQGYFNMAKAYAQKQDYTNVISALKRYAALSKEECTCAFLTETKEFNPIKDSLRFIPVKDSCCFNGDHFSKENKLKHPEVLTRLLYLEGKEQEILGCPECSGGYRKKCLDALKVNFAEFATLIDTTNLPDHDEIGRGTAYVEIIVLHTDYYPTLQYSLGKKILTSGKKGYNTKMGAYIIDRSLSNMGKPQLYGTMLNKEHNALYQYDDLEKVKKRRAELGMQTIEEYLKNRSITK